MALLVAPLLTAGCERGRGESVRPPNILLVVWDTARRDRMSLYGHTLTTTPFVDAWARQARVYDNCTSTGSTTVPAHGSIFTGLLPYQHGAHNNRPHLDPQWRTLAELLKARGYATYSFCANPHISQETYFTRGFDLDEHPWSPPYLEEAIRITASKITPEDESTELAERIRRGLPLMEWNVKTSGALAQRGVEKWLDARPADQPFFIFLNYMEVHRPLIPPREYRERFMSPDQVDRSYKVDRTWVPTWAFAFGLHEYTPEELELTALTYDAAMAELDDLFRDLIESLRARGALENTVVVLTSDHGEHLGEHHMLDHQFSVYNELIYVPLIVHYPPRFPAGRDPRPAMNMDLLPTLLELAGAAPPPDLATVARHLLELPEQRPRLGEYPEAPPDAISRVERAYPSFDGRPWNRALRAFYNEPYKLIWASDGRHELYHVLDDPGERHNLAASDPDTLDGLLMAYERYMSSLELGLGAEGQLSEDFRRRAESLGYVGGEQKDDGPP